MPGKFPFVMGKICLHPEIINIGENQVFFFSCSVYHHFLLNEKLKYMRAESVGLREMVVIINRLASMVNWKMNKKTMKSILYKCGFCVSPKRTNSVTLLGGLRTSIQQVIPSWGSELPTKE